MRTQPLPAVDPQIAMERQKRLQEDVIVLPSDGLLDASGLVEAEAEPPRPPPPERLQDGAFDRIFTERPAPAGAEGKVPEFPLLKNLSRYWQQDVIVPMLPCECGNPNTAARNASRLTDADLARVSPVMKPMVFADWQNGKDLMTRFQRAWIDLTGVNPIPGRYANRDDDDILQRLPQKARRLSF
jgi:hypothetical protein